MLESLFLVLFAKWLGDENRLNRQAPTIQNGQAHTQTTRRLLVCLTICGVGA